MNQESAGTGGRAQPLLWVPEVFGEHHHAWSLLPNDRKSPCQFLDTDSPLTVPGPSEGQLCTGGVFLKKQTQTRSVSGVECRNALRQKQMGVATRDGQTSSEKMPPAPAPTLPNFLLFQIRASLIIFLCTCCHLVPRSGLRRSSRDLSALWDLRPAASFGW